MLVMDRIQIQSCCNFAGGLSNFAGGLSRQLLRSNAGMFYKKCQILEIGGNFRKEIWNLNIECLPKKMMRGNLENERKEELNCNLFQKGLHQSITLVIIKNYFKLHIKLRTIKQLVIQTFYKMKIKLVVCLRSVELEQRHLLPVAGVVVSSQDSADHSVLASMWGHLGTCLRTRLETQSRSVSLQTMYCY